jgi:hypothetical protein
MTEPPAAKAKERPTFRLVLRSEPHCREPTHALRGLLKIALRTFGFKCMSVEEMKP